MFGNNTILHFHLYIIAHLCNNNILVFILTSDDNESETKGVREFEMAGRTATDVCLRQPLLRKPQVEPPTETMVTFQEENGSK